MCKCFVGSIIGTIIGIGVQPVNAEFVGELLLRDVAANYEDHGESDPGHTEFELLADYSYRAADGTLWTAPSGTVVNGASIPRVVWSSVGGPWSGKYRNAAVVHDYLTAEKPSSSEVVHGLFLDGMLENGVSKARAHLMYAAVVTFGGKWNDAGNFVADGEPIEMTENDLEMLRSYLEENDPTSNEISDLRVEDIQ